jgi:hypothetical protein
MTSTVPVSRVVAVSVTLTPAGALAQSLANMLLLGVSSVIDTVERTSEQQPLNILLRPNGLVSLRSRPS